MSPDISPPRRLCRLLLSRCLGIHPNTILNRIHGLSTFARWFIKQQRAGKQILATNPTPGWGRPRGITPQTKVLLPDEMVKFLAVPLDPDLALARELLVGTGMRCLEACEANISDLRDVNGIVYLTLHVKGRRQARSCASQPTSWRAWPASMRRPERPCSIIGA
jgi:integrase